MENEKIDLTNLLNEIDLAEEQCLSTLKKLRQQRLELTGEDSRIHRVHNPQRSNGYNTRQSLESGQITILQQTERPVESISQN